MPAGDQDLPDLPEELGPHGTGTAELICLDCLAGMHTRCRTVTAEAWCECLCGWACPDGVPPTFWRFARIVPDS